MFEMDQAASVLSPGGVMLVDDIATHEGFARFAMRHPSYRTIVCPSADRIGLFGIAVNTAEADLGRRRGGAKFISADQRRDEQRRGYGEVEKVR